MRLDARPREVSSPQELEEDADAVWRAVGEELDDDCAPTLDLEQHARTARTRVEVRRLVRVASPARNSARTFHFRRTSGHSRRGRLRKATAPALRLGAAAVRQR